MAAGWAERSLEPGWCLQDSRAEWETLFEEGKDQGWPRPLDRRGTVGRLLSPVPSASPALLLMCCTRLRNGTAKPLFEVKFWSLVCPLPVFHFFFLVLLFPSTLSTFVNPPPAHRPPPETDDRLVGVCRSGDTDHNPQVRVVGDPEMVPVEGWR